eukprot:TRINITY_DN110705_c0_g1_i1.p1 TRINITY_DN110705_c0_g1~~TRINITY_DN110705_c0_g1_i1.p1  ORF type:complete len:310 (-),score=8.30 TRINITY_DN110705_c0_g1_i1:163-1092(-)
MKANIETNTDTESSTSALSLLERHPVRITKGHMSCLRWFKVGIVFESFRLVAVPQKHVCSCRLYRFLDRLDLQTHCIAKMSQIGRMPKCLLEDKYANFGDSSMKDRLAFQMHRMRGGHAPPAPPPEPSGRSNEGWDKYFFFSSCNGAIGNTARKGRNRPSASGPQTFSTEAFSKEELALERARIEALGPRTTYTEGFSQFPRTTQAEFGPPGECYDSHGGKVPGSMTSSASAPTIPESRIMAAHEFLDRVRPEGRVIRRGPMWPPPGAERPDPVKTRRELMRGCERHIVDLYASDRQAPHSYHYVITNR